MAHEMALSFAYVNQRSMNPRPRLFFHHFSEGLSRRSLLIFGLFYRPVVADSARERILPLPQREMGANGAAMTWGK